MDVYLSISKKEYKVHKEDRRNPMKNKTNPGSPTLNAFNHADPTQPGFFYVLRFISKDNSARCIYTI